MSPHSSHRKESNCQLFLHQFNIVEFRLGNWCYSRSHLGRCGARVQVRVVVSRGNSAAACFRRGTLGWLWTTKRLSRGGETSYTGRRQRRNPASRSRSGRCGFNIWIVAIARLAMAAREATMPNIKVNRVSLSIAYAAVRSFGLSRA
jgi:hypothetical protein